MAVRTSKNRPDNTSLKDGFVLHPNYLIRVCGEPANLINGTTTGATSEHLERIFQLSEWLENHKEEYCKYVEERVQGLDDRQISNKLLKLKRNIFNIRAINPELLEEVKTVFDAESFQKVAEIAERINQLFDYRAQLETVYKEENETVSLHLKEIWDNACNLQHALSYSNTKLFSDFASLYRDPNKKVKPKKRRQLEAGLLRYASRSSLKTSPLSTFTPVFVGKWREAQDPENVTMSGELENRMEVKAGLFQAMLDSLLSNYEKVKTTFSLKVNPSLSIQGDQIFLTKLSAGASVNGRVWGTGETEIKFKINQVIQCILVAFQKLGKASATVPEIIAAVLQLAPKLEQGFVDKAIGQLFDMQLFVTDSKFFGQVELLAWCKQVLQTANDEASQQALQRLDNLEALLKQFPFNSPEERLATGRAINDEIAAIAECLEATPSEELAHPAFFENSYLVDDSVCIDENILAPFSDDFHMLSDLSPFFDIHQLAQTNFADFFLDRFGAEGECDDVIAFIKDFSDRYGVGQPDFVPDPEKLSPSSDITRGFKQAIVDFVSELLDTVFADDEQGKRVEYVQLNSESLQAHIEKLPQAIRNRVVSHSYLGQIASKNDDKLFVINQVFSGHSGLLSRFLEVLEEDDLKDIRDYLNDVSRDGTYAEIPGLFGFNANKHPKLAERELLLEPFPSNREETEKLSLKQLKLVYDAETHKVFFKQPDGKLVDCLYHGFLMPLLLPNMHRILTLLNMNGVLIYVLPILRSGRFSTREKIGLIPRVSVGNTVLIRKSYMVPRELLPSVELSELEFFEAIQLFIKEHKLPNAGFIRVSPFDTNPGSTDSKLDWANLDFKNMKPFYVDFRNPRLVQLLYLALSRNDYPIVISETLPDVDDQHLQVDGKYHVAEFQFEMTKKPVVSGTASEAPE